MTSNRANEHGVFEYYSAKRETGRSVLELWERGEPFRDSVTPSVWSAEYRAWMVRRIESLCRFDPDRRIVSIGCGNAFVEAELMRAGYRLAALDALPEAVEIARGKGVDAVVCDFWNCAETVGGGFDVVYADGVVGHLLARAPLDAILAEMTKLAAPQAIILISNDSAANGATESHPTVPAFSYISADYIVAAARAVGLESEMVVRYPYSRPLSGPRWRSVVALRALPRS